MTEEQQNEILFAGTGLTVAKLRAARAVFDASERRAARAIRDACEAEDREVERQEAFADWLSTRPASVQALARRFPLGTTFTVDGVEMHLLGYTEPDGLWVTPIYPGQDYEGALEAKVHICGKCLKAHLAPLA